MELNLYDRYDVRGFDDFKSNYKQVVEVKGFLNRNLNSPDSNSICIISGCLASGKTTILRLIEGYRADSEVLMLTHQDEYSKAFHNFVHKRSIENMIFKKKRYILIDDIHLFDKQFICNIAKTNLRGADVKVVVTVQHKEESKITELKSQKVNALYLKLNKISFQDCFLVISDLIETLNLSDKVDLNDVIRVIKYNNCNLRQTLQSLKKTDEMDSSTDVANYSDMNVYDLTKTFVKSKVNDKFVSLAMSNLVLFLVYENLPNSLPLKNKTHREQNIQTHIDILRSIITFNDEVHMHDHISNTILNYYSMININRLITQAKGKQETSLKYTNIFNKLSIQSSFHKKLSSYSKNEIFCKPYERAMCLRDKNDFAAKKNN